MWLYSCRMLVPGIREEVGMSVSVWGSAFCSTGVSIADRVSALLMLKWVRTVFFCGPIDAWRCCKYRDCSSVSCSDSEKSDFQCLNFYSPLQFSFFFWFEVDVIICFFSSKWDCSKGTVLNTVNSMENWFISVGFWDASEKCYRGLFVLLILLL